MGNIKRIWEIDDDYDYGRGGVDFDGHLGFRHEGMSMAEEHAYKKGCEHGYEKGMKYGYEKAMEEARGYYGERGGRSGGYSSGSGSGGGGGRMSYREADYHEDPFAMDERRRRDSRGRFM